jgi:hypothetical protein
MCIAVDNAGNFIRYNGSTWSAPAPAESFTGSLGSVSCASTTFCVAVDNFLGGASLYNGTTWSDISMSGGAGAVSSVSCPTTSFCMAVDAFGNAFSYDGSAWTEYANMDPSLMFSDGSLPPSSVSCASSSMCIAVDSESDAYRFDGSTWSPAQSLGGGQLTGVSCPTASFCLAVDVDGQAYTFNGTTWSAPSGVAPNNDGFVGVSCPTSSFCGAGDDGGNLLLYAAPGEAPVIITPILAAAKLASPYQAKTFHAFGGIAPYHWKKIGTLPKGMKFKNGVLSGTPKTTDRPGNYTFSVSVRDSTKHAHQTATVTVSLNLS